ncbi:transmembrane sensor [Pedobacter africanus]|uniref:Ferric-dicitrate binding protein FerR (Iron transport regulator) n=1 Tax=Pedobacter africanus TaxID=151894 RepID=A0ACC6KUX2_9SPHI|nr:FecR domain-containing protein [Pedobacter africanus]MDR6783034.1 ferric-dicitrate binding protein FerR (iron transport regulator) [Pedobacter africanus]
MTLQEVKDLLKPIAAGTSTPSQRDAFATWLDYAEQSDYKELLQAWEKLLEDQPAERLHHPELISRIEASIDKTEVAAVPLYERKKNLFLNWKTVAAAVIAITFVIFLYRSMKNTSLNNGAQYANEIKPGGNNAVLVLADGSKIDLNKLGTGEVARQAGIKIVKSADGQLVYTIIKNSDANAGGLFNTIKTPIGGQYKVNLPDGSQVWLNAASSLRYPVAFGNDERRVELTGEAYFEVAKDKARPFRVLSSQQTVEVLGTHFNINSYADEGNTRTTLLEGRVKVFTAVNKKNVILNPGQQSQVDTYNISVKDVDASEAAAWKEGYFVFNAESIPSAMRKLARWYDLEISYEGNINDKDLAGSVSRFKNVSEVLKTLELTDMVHFEIDGRKIKVIAN